MAKKKKRGIAGREVIIGAAAVTVVGGIAYIIYKATHIFESWGDTLAVTSGLRKGDFITVPPDVIQMKDPTKTYVPIPERRGYYTGPLSEYAYWGMPKTKAYVPTTIPETKKIPVTPELYKAVQNTVEQYRKTAPENRLPATVVPYHGILSQAQREALLAQMKPSLTGKGWVA